MPNINDRLPERQVSPTYRTRSFIARRSGARPGERGSAGGAGGFAGGGAGGSGVGSIGGAGVPGTSGSVPKVATLPSDANEVRTGQMYLIAGADGEPDRLVFALRMGDGTLEYRDVTQASSGYPVVFLTAWGAQGTGNGQFNSVIRALAVNTVSGYVYATSDDRLQRFTASGLFGAVMSSAGSGTGQSLTAYGLAYIPSNQLLVQVDNGNDRMHVYNAITNTRVLTLGSPGIGPNEFEDPHHLGYQYVPGSVVPSVLVTDLGATPGITDGRVIRWGVGGTPVLVMWVNQNYEKILWDGKRYVILQANMQRLVVTTLGVSSFIIGGPGSGPGKFNNPTDIALDRFGNIYVVDSGNNRIQVFDRIGVFLGEWGGLGTSDGKFTNPTSIAVTDSYIYVGDSGNYRIQMFTNPLAAQLGEVVEVTKGAPGGQTNTSTTTYVTTVTIDTYSDFDGAPEPLVLPSGLWEYTATYHQTYYATSVATWGMIGRFNGTIGASPTYQVANLGGNRASLTVAHLGVIASDGATVQSIRFEFVRNGTWAATPATEPGYMTLRFRKIG